MTYMSTRPVGRVSVILCSIAVFISGKRYTCLQVYGNEHATSATR